MWITHPRPLPGLLLLAILLTALPGGAIENGILISPPSAPDHEHRRQLVAWYAIYEAEMAPIRQAVAPVVALLHGQGNEGTHDCQRLWDQLRRIDTGALFPVPDFAVSHHLRRLINHLSAAAAACLDRQPGIMVHQLDRAGAAFTDITLALAPYGLEP